MIGLTFTASTRVNMTYLYILHLILAGLLGSLCEITTVHNVPVKTGGSISIPCLYEPNYRNHVKYLCVGYWPLFCFNVIATNQTEIVSGRYSISDDTIQRIFTVTIKDLSYKDQYLWCAVEIKNKVDVKQHFQLLVRSGMPSLYVSNQEITTLERGSVTVECHCDNPKITEWCRLGSTCVTNQTILSGGTTVKIDTRFPDVFHVTMTDLRTENSGWYWCACNNLQMPIHITVHELATITTTPTTTPVISKTAKDAELHTAQPTRSTIPVGGRNLQDEQKSSTNVFVISTLLSQLLVILAAFFGWRIRKHKRTKSEVCDINVESDFFDSGMLYATIDHYQHATVQPEDHVHTENVTYSTIAIKDNAQQKSAAPERSVIYSMLKYNEPK